MAILHKPYNGAYTVDVGNTVIDIPTYAFTIAGVPVGGVRPVVAATAATLAITPAAHAGKTVTLGRAAGQAVTLPAATGTGAVYVLCVSVTITSLTTTIITASASDFLAGNVIQLKTDGTVKGYNCNGTSHRTLTFDGSTKGGIIGDKITLIDMATNVWQVVVEQTATGVVATPVS